MEPNTPAPLLARKTPLIQAQERRLDNKGEAPVTLDIILVVNHNGLVELLLLLPPLLSTTLGCCEWTARVSSHLSHLSCSLACRCTLCTYISTAVPAHFVPSRPHSCYRFQKIFPHINQELKPLGTAEERRTKPQIFFAPRRPGQTRYYQIRRIQQRVATLLAAQERNLFPLQERYLDWTSGIVGWNLFATRLNPNALQTATQTTLDCCASS